MTSTRKPTEQEWWSYDSVAAVYDRLLARNFFAPLARDLVTMVSLPWESRVLDVGTGTGVAGIPALEAVRPGGAFIGLDPSLAMLRCVKDKGALWPVAGKVPGLPFSDNTFDGVLAQFVLSHVPRYEIALSDLVRVLRQRGKLGITAWGGGQSEPRRMWQEIAEAFISRDLPGKDIHQAIPWEEWFSDAAHLRDALRQAGLVTVHVEQREYRTTLSVSDYLSGRETSLQARFMRQMLDEVRWARFKERLAEIFRCRFQDSINEIKVVHLAVGTKPRLD